VPRAGVKDARWRGRSSAVGCIGTKKELTRCHADNGRLGLPAPDYTGKRRAWEKSIAYHDQPPDFLNPYPPRTMQIAMPPPRSGVVCHPVSSPLHPLYQSHCSTLRSSPHFSRVRGYGGREENQRLTGLGPKKGLTICHADSSRRRFLRRSTRHPGPDFYRRELGCLRIESSTGVTCGKRPTRTVQSSSIC
jgi:hypothetical protein